MSESTQLPSISEVAAAITERRSVDPKASATPESVSTAPTETAPEPTAEAPVEGGESAEVVTAAPEQPKADPVSSKFAALARKEKEARRREIEADKRVAEAEARIKAAEQKAAQYEGWGKDPLAAAKAAGYSYEDLVRLGLGIKEPAPIDPLDERINPLKKQIEDMSKNDIDQIKAEIAEFKQRDAANALQEVQRNIRSTVDGGNYDLIKSVGEDAFQLVQDVMTEYFHATKGKILTYDEAADRVESYYENHLGSIVGKSQKLKSKFEPKTPAVPTKPIPSKEAKGPTTLTNAVNASSKAIDVNKLPKQDALEYLAQKYLNQKL